MTAKDGTFCTLIQGFPLLLIIAQKYHKCLYTPFVYKPPQPTHTPEYYEALEALYSQIFGHGSDEYGHGHPTYHGQPNYGHDTTYHGYGNKYPDFGNKYPMPSYGQQYPVYGAHKPGYHYPGYSNNHHGHPGMYYKKCTNDKCTVYSSKTGSGFDKYAPNQTYNVHNKYKVVVKKNKHRGHRRRSGKLTARGKFLLSARYTSSCPASADAVKEIFFDNDDDDIWRHGRERTMLRNVWENKLGP